MERTVGCVNERISALADSPRWGPRIGRHITKATYTGRRSGRTFTMPLGYRRAGDVVTIGVRMPDAKSWWRNFTGEGHPLSLRLDGADHPGHAVASRDERGRVTVTVQLDRTR